jgi:fermentation-respiration switch protein FrsA (DUF1100 family)
VLSLRFPAWYEVRTGMRASSIFRLLLVGVPALVAAYWLLLFFAQRAMLFPRSFGAAPPRPGDAEQLWLSTPVGRIEAWYLPPATPPSAPAPLLLFAHGNGELIDHWSAGFVEPRAWGFGVLLVEYPGYGRSEGAPSEASIRAAMLAAYDWAKADQRVDARRIVAHGRSLGGGAVCLLAAARPLAALILESTFTSVRAFAPRFGGPSFLVRDPFDNLAVLADYRGPLLVLHGERDEVIPSTHGRALAATRADAEYRGLPCGHNDCDAPWIHVHPFLAKHHLLGSVTPR